MKHKHVVLTSVLLSFLIGILSCFGNVYNKHKASYNFSEPSVSLTLPDTLREISGLTVLNDNEIACVQDENGILFIYDIATNEIKRQLTFHTDGDYEGVTHVGKTVYVLRSDGVVFEISDYTSPHFKVDSIITGIPADNSEGLCYDKAHKRLLVACKNPTGKDSALRSKRMVYGIDLKTKTTIPDPIYIIDVNDLKRFAQQHAIDLPKRPKKNTSLPDPIVRFKPSAISIHPITQRLYMLSATDHLLFVFDKSGTLEHMELLDPQLFNKAEGISFLPNGDLLISNEGQEKKPSILRFNY